MNDHTTPQDATAKSAPTLGSPCLVPCGWWEEYACGCVSETVERKKDLLGYCGKHGDERRHCHRDRKMTREGRWFAAAVPAKIGTIPMIVRFDLRTPLRVGAKVRFQTCCFGNWETGVVSCVDPLRVGRF